METVFFFLKKEIGIYTKVVVVGGGGGGGGS